MNKPYDVFEPIGPAIDPELVVIDSMFKTTFVRLDANHHLEKAELLGSPLNHINGMGAYVDLDFAKKICCEANDQDEAAQKMAAAIEKL